MVVLGKLEEFPDDLRMGGRAGLGGESDSGLFQASGERDREIKQF